MKLNNRSFFGKEGGIHLNKLVAGFGIITLLAFFGLVWLVAGGGAQAGVVPVGQVPAAGGVQQGNAQQFPAVIDGFQTVDITATNTGAYDKKVVYLKAGVPVRVRFKADQYAGCGRQMIIPDFGVSAVANAGGPATTLEFTPTKPGTYAYRCGMNMFRGQFIVV